ncbi:LysR family transcriptional regulator [Vreelandella utahensis]|uniref:LysR family transcriptional regulator n=1 Tax=Vreelandella halophila TaxID=86177 RepID=UPI00098786E2|nr:LysR family transcriptional regulator [Halomonas utahensis]
MKYTLRQLEVFLATARNENITRAADELAMSQSAASGALRDLENQFSVQLFDRMGKRLQLNELGRLVRPRVAALLDEAQELEHALARHAEVGHVKVGATLTIGNYMAVPIMARFMSENEGANVSLEIANTRTIGRKVADFELDVGLIEGEIHSPELEVIPWRGDRLTVFCAPDHPMAGREALTDEDLLAATWILREGGSGTRQTFDRAMHGLLPDLNVLLELQHTEAIKRAVGTGMGVGCLSEVALRDAFERGDLIPLPVPHRDLARSFYFILHRQKYRSAGVDQWLKLCRETTGLTGTMEAPDDA